MMIRFDYIAIGILLLGYFVPQYAFLGEISLWVIITFMALMVVVFVLLLNDLVFKFTTTAQLPKSWREKVIDFISYVTVVGLAAQAGYIIEVALLMLLTVINISLSRAVRDKLLAKGTGVE